MYITSYIQSIYMHILYLLALVLSATAATLFSVTPNFTISYEKRVDELAHAYYDQKLTQQGMNYFYVYANGLKTLIEQHRGAGFLEGYTTYMEIQAAYLNLNNFKINDASVKPKLQEYLNNQIDFIETMAEKFPRDIYWQYANAYLEQCRYTYRGFLQRIHEQNRLDMYIGFSQFYYITNVGDFRQLLPAYNTASQSELTEKDCTIYVKKVNDDLYVSHSTGSYYPYMLRVVKSYNFPTRNENVGSETITFTSRPGDLNSKDSFYILSSGLKVTETSFMNFNKDNYKQLSFKTVPSWVRVSIASNLARNGQEWTDYFGKYNSATHSGQWIIIDKSKINSESNLVVFFQQAFSMIKITDMTQTIKEQGYVGSYNVPLNSHIYDKLQYQTYAYTYETDPSAILLKNLSPKMTNEENIKHWMLVNNETDPGKGIAPRGDLSSNIEAYGLIDCKVTSLNTDKSNYFWMISSPTTSQGRFPAFSWNAFPNMTHEGMPTEYKFSWQKVPIDIEKDFEERKNLLIQ